MKKDSFEKLADWFINLSDDFRNIINSYLGMLKQYKRYKISKKIILNKSSVYFWNYFYIRYNYKKGVQKGK